MSRIVLAHAPRQATVRLTFDVRQKKIMQIPELSHLSGMSGFALFLIAVYLIIWTASLVSAIRNELLNDITRFMWVFVIMMAPIIGMMLYFFLAPSRPPKETPI